MLPTVKMDPSIVTPRVKEYLRCKIEDQAEFPPTNYDAIFEAGLRFLYSGGDARTFSLELQPLCTAGVTSKRIGQLTTHIWASCRSIMDRERMLEIGIKECVWKYSRAGCMEDRKHPSAQDLVRDAAHRAAHNKRYKVEEGLKINDQWVYPGEEPGCGCSSRIHIPGF